ncbi:MAG: hypothetical protein WB821_04525 [Burkholderiaceae bacterium]
MNRTLNTQNSLAKDTTMQHAPPSLAIRANTLPRFHQARQSLLAVAVFTLATGSAQAQTIEDHSLPKSAIKTFHVKCSSGRLGMVRYDTRPEPTKMCVSVQDGSRAQSCVNVTQQQAPQHVNVLGGWVCAN